MRLYFLFFLASVSLAFSPYRKMREFLGLERRDNGYYVYTIDGEVISVPTAGDFYGLNYWSWFNIYTTDGYLVYSYFGEVVSIPLSYYDSADIPFLLSDYSYFYGSGFNPIFFTDSFDISFPSIDIGIGTAGEATEGSGGGETQASATAKGTNGGNGSGTEKTTEATGTATTSGPITTSPSKSSIVSSIKSSIKSSLKSANSAKESGKSQSSASASASETSSKNFANLQTTNVVMVPLMLVFSILFM